MKKIINGKLYDTSTAKEIAEANYPPMSPLDGKDYHIGWSETLYLTQKGAWFLVREDYNRAGGMLQRRLIPYTPDEALAWLEVRAEVDVALEWFADQVVEA